MQEFPEAKKSIDLSPWANDLVCPVCFAALDFSEDAVVCTGCGRRYPVIDGIPALIPQRANPAKS